jgi:hypothetical protein
MTTTELEIIIVLMIYLVGLGFTISIKDADEPFLLTIIVFITSPGMMLIRIGALIGKKL